MPLGPSLATLHDLGALVAERAVALTLGTGVLLAGALLLDRLLERRVGAGTRLLLYAAVLVRVFVAPAWSTPVGLVSGGVVTGHVPTLTVGAAAGGAWSPEILLALGYLAGVGVLLARWWLARRRLDQRLASALPTRAGALAGAAGEIPIEEHDHLGPLVAGVLRPRVVLPRGLVREADPDVLGFLVAHEAAHVARADHWTTVLVQLTVIAAWPVLPVWIAARRLRALMELACDERVLAGCSGAERRRYGELLVALALDEPRLLRAPLTPAFGWALRNRVRALRRPRHLGVVVQRTLIAGLGAALFACAAPSPGDEPPESAPVAAEQPVHSPVPAHDHDRIVAVQTAMQARTGDFKRCFERYLAAEASGDSHSLRINVNLVINGAGAIERSRVTGAVPVPQLLVECISVAARAWTFPADPWGRPVEFNFPLILQGRDR